VICWQVGETDRAFAYLSAINAMRKRKRAALWGLLKVVILVTWIYWRVKRMPRATVSITVERKDLLSLPPIDATDVTAAVEGGWVELRRMSYGEKIAKDAEAMKMKFGMDDAAAGNMNAEVAMINEKVTLLEFQRCIVDHNLTAPIDKNDESKGERPLNFQKLADIQSLDPRVGDEISQLIGEMNDFERTLTENKKDSSGK
jgi:hypothetical protein